MQQTKEVYSGKSLLQRVGAPDPNDEPVSAIFDGVRAECEKVADVNKRAALSVAERKRQGKKCLTESYCTAWVRASCFGKLWRMISDSGSCVG